MNQMWFDGYDWYIAESADEAQKFQIELTGEDQDRDSSNEFVSVDPDSDLTFVDDDGKRETRKVSEWLKDHTKGFFASTES